MSIKIAPHATDIFLNCTVKDLSDSIMHATPHVIWHLRRWYSYAS